MNRSLLLASLAFVVAVSATTLGARAQATRTFVSGVGDDANPCSRTAPCKTWAGAISKTTVGGEIDALDPGGFGALTITHAITLDGGGGQVASVLTSGTPGITVAAGANDLVTLRNLRFQGIVASGSAGTIGINVTTAGQVNVENCYVANFAQAGINFAPSGKAVLNVTDSTIEGNQGGGIIVTGASGVGARATIDSTNVLNNIAYPSGSTPGIEATGLARVSISNSTISGNYDGVFATGRDARAFVDQSQIVNNAGNGLHTSASASIAVAGSSISLNELYGVISDTGSVRSYGNNYLYENIKGAGTFTTPNLSPSIHNRLFPNDPYP